MIYESGGAVPSWSFLGWTGSGLDLRAWDELYNNQGRRGPDERSFRSEHHLSLCVEFFKVDSRTGARELIQSSYYAGSGRCLPNRAAADDQRARGTHASRAYHFVQIPSEPLSLSNVSWMPVLEFRTQRCRIAAGDVIPRAQGESSEDCVDVCLGGRDGPVVGAIRLNALRVGDDDEGARPGELLDLVVISRWVSAQTRSTRMIPELRIFHAECPQPCFSPHACQADSRVVPYEFYNVMWIGWNGDVAYRKAVGRVLVSYWDEQQPEDVQITLRWAFLPSTTSLTVERT